MNFMKLSKFKSKSNSNILCDNYTQNTSKSTHEKFFNSVSASKISASKISESREFLPSLEPGVDRTKQQTILRFRSRGGRPLPPGCSANGTPTTSAAPKATSTPQSMGTWAQASQPNPKVSHADCKKREQQLQEELKSHVKYIEKQALALQQMEQTIAYQYAMIQQMSAAQQQGPSQQQQQQQQQKHPQQMGHSNQAYTSSGASSASSTSSQYSSSCSAASSSSSLDALDPMASLLQMALTGQGQGMEGVTSRKRAVQRVEDESWET